MKVFLFHRHHFQYRCADDVDVCLQIAHKYLVEKHLSPENLTQFKEQLYRIWFELYARRGSSRSVGSTEECDAQTGTDSL